jgi:hypothetical protein
LAWNSGNTMNFLKRSTQGLEYRNSENPSVVDRARTGQLYHRKIHILTQDSNLFERATFESLGKVQVYQYCNYKKTGKPDLESLGAELFKAFFRPTQNTPQPSDLTSCEKINPGGSYKAGTTLAVFMGADPVTTLISIWSHQPETLWLLYTSGSPQVERLKEYLYNHSDRLPVHRVIFQNVDFAGTYLMKLPAPAVGQLAVNVSPGTKSHTFFLTRWAMANLADVYSINNTDASMQPISSGVTLPKKIPAPVVFLEVKGEAIKSTWGGRAELLCIESKLLDLKRFIDLIHEDSAKVRQFPNGGTGHIEAGSAVFFKQARDLGRIEFDGGKHFVEFSLEQNIWLEQLVGYMMLKCGAQEVAVSTKVRWSAETEMRLQKHHKAFLKNDGDFTAKNDYDVIAAFGGTYVMVECKSGNDESETKMISQCRGLVSTLPRFTLPMLCRFNYHGEPKKQDDVWIFGHRTLTDAAALKNLIHEALAAPRTTSPAREAITCKA